jgi:hypothetical protein
MNLVGQAMKESQLTPAFPASQEQHIEDSGLLLRVASGDERGLSALYDRHSKLVYSVALKISRDSALAEVGWLALSSRNRALGVLRRKRKESSNESAVGCSNNVSSQGAVSPLLEKAHALVLTTRRMIESYWIWLFSMGRLRLRFQTK